MLWLEVQPGPFSCFGFCAKGGWEIPEDSLDVQGLIHPAQAQRDDRHDLISGREQQKSVNKRETY